MGDYPSLLLASSMWVSPSLSFVCVTCKDEHIPGNSWMYTYTVNTMLATHLWIYTCVYLHNSPMSHTFINNTSHWISLALSNLPLQSNFCANNCTLTCPWANMSVPAHFNHPTTHMASLWNCPSLYIVMLPFLIPSSQQYAQNRQISMYRHIHLHTHVSMSSTYASLI